MNWYKIAKLIDKKHHTDKNSIFSQCCYCKRWATQGELGVPEWKVNLDPEERSSSTQGKVSHGVCPICWSIIEKYGFKTDAEQIAKMSLATTSK